MDLCGDVLFIGFVKNIIFFRKRLKNNRFSLPVMCKRENNSYRKDDNDETPSYY